MTAASQGGVRAYAAGHSETRTLLPLCPVCGSDDAEPEAVVGTFAEGAMAALFLRCGLCTAAYVNPPAAATDAHPGGSPSLVSRRRLSRWSEDLPPEANRLQIDAGELATNHQPASYDLVVVPLALDTSEAPLQLIEDIRTLLRPGGRAVVLTRNLDSPTFDMFGRRHWSGYFFPHNRQVFTLESLRWLGRQAGLELRRTETLFDHDIWLSSFRNLLEDWTVPAWLVSFTAGSWLLPEMAAAVLEGASVMGGRGSVLVAYLEKP